MPPSSANDDRANIRTDLIEKDLTDQIIGRFYYVYNKVGFGLFESNYARGMEVALRRRGLLVEREFPIQVFLDEDPIGFFRADMLVERRVVVEVKATDVLPRFARRQLRTYLCALRLEVGLLLHFGPEPKFERVVWRP